MARILFLHIRYPEFDRSSGDLRFANVMRILSQQHEVALHVLHQRPGYLTDLANKAYADLMSQLGIRTVVGSLFRHLREQAYDLVIIEYWYVARSILKDIRALQPQSRIVVDTEHVYFYSDQVREAAIGADSSAEEQAERKRGELDVYRQADAILTTTDEDRDVVQAEAPEVVCRTVPNIHAMPNAPVGRREGRLPASIVFVGNFRQNFQNADAIAWFCREVMPRVLASCPQARLRIVGNMPPPDVQALAGDHVEVTGYVPDTAPYLDSSLVSICPLRFGAGLKGKIGEAMAHGVPVVSTSVGTQGMQPAQGEEIMIADDPEAFAKAITHLFADEATWRRLSLGGRSFIEQRFGFEAVKLQLNRIFGDLSWLPARSRRTLSTASWALRIRARNWLQENVLWRWRG